MAAAAQPFWRGGKVGRQVRGSAELPVIMIVLAATDRLWQLYVIVGSREESSRPPLVKNLLDGHARVPSLFIDLFCWFSVLVHVFFWPVQCTQNEVSGHLLDVDL